MKEWAWEAFAANAYKTITGREEFRILIGKDGAETELTFHQTLGEMSPVYVANSFADYDWTLADSADWIAMLQAEEFRGDKAIRRLWGTRVKKFGERWMANVMEVETIGSGHRTKITVEELKVEESK